MMKSYTVARRMLAHLRHGAPKGLEHLQSPLAPLGISLVPAPGAVRGAVRFVRDMNTYRSLTGVNSRFPIVCRHCYPILTDWSQQAGITDPHYFYQDLWAARRIHRRSPSAHVDVGSRIDGFIAHLLTFMPVTIVDIRRLDWDVTCLQFEQADATNLKAFADDSLESLSSLSAVEHFGLGRYGDPVHPLAPFQALAAFERVLAPDGFLYLSVPVGKERLEFNAHRIFAPQTVQDALPLLSLT
jgi:hypothetical protein